MTLNHGLYTIVNKKQVFPPQDDVRSYFYVMNKHTVHRVHINITVVCFVGDGVLRTRRSASRVRPAEQGVVAVQGRAGCDTSPDRGPDQSAGGRLQRATRAPGGS